MIILRPAYKFSQGLPANTAQGIVSPSLRSLALECSFHLEWHLSFNWLMMCIKYKQRAINCVIFRLKVDLFFLFLNKNNTLTHGTNYAHDLFEIDALSVG